MLLVPGYPKIVKSPVVLQLLIVMWIPCSSSQLLREIHAKPGQSLNVTCHNCVEEHMKAMISWCRQMSGKECLDVMDSKWMKRHTEKRLVSMIQKLGETVYFTVTMMQLQHFDTGLYKWQKWTGQHYDIIESVLLQVVEESPTELEVIKAISGDSAEMRCPYGKQQRWSKIWCKQVGMTCDWVVHSDGKTNSDYQKRTVISNNLNSRTLTMKLTSLELWDSGLYLCQESGGQTVLNKVLLLVIPKGENNPSDHTGKLEYKSVTHPNHLLTSPSTQPPRITERQYKFWDILRWVLLVPMVLCLLVFSCYERIFAGTSHISNEDYGGGRNLGHKRHL